MKIDIGYRSSKSWTKEQLIKKILSGEKVWILDTDSGDDDILCGEYDVVLSDVLSFHELKKLPDTWKIRKADIGIGDDVITVV